MNMLNANGQSLDVQIISQAKSWSDFQKLKKKYNFFKKFNFKSASAGTSLASLNNVMMEEFMYNGKKKRLVFVIKIYIQIQKDKKELRGKIENAI